MPEARIIQLLFLLAFFVNWLIDDFVAMLERTWQQNRHHASAGMQPLQPRQLTVLLQRRALLALRLRLLRSFT